MPCIIINDKYTGAILWSTGMFAYMHTYTRKHTCAHNIHPYIHASAITETMAMVHTVHVNRLLPQSVLQWDTNWKGEKTHKTKRGTSVCLDFSTQEGVTDVIFFITGGQQEAGLTKDRENTQPFTLLTFMWGAVGMQNVRSGTNVMARQFPEHQVWGCKDKKHVACFKSNPVGGRSSWRYCNLLLGVHAAHLCLSI